MSPEAIILEEQYKKVQVGGNHYKSKKIQPIDYILGNNLSFCEGNIIKYVTRYKDKNGVEDILKAIHFLEKLVEVEKRKQQEIDLPKVMQIWQGKPLDWELDAMDNRNEGR